MRRLLFRPGAFDRIVVWGDPTTVASVQSRAAFTRTIYFNPRFGVSLIGKEAFTGNLAEVVSKAAADSVIYNQQSCASSLVHYVEGSSEQVDEYARRTLRRYEYVGCSRAPVRAAGNGGSAQTPAPGQVQLRPLVFKYER